MKDNDSAGSRKANWACLCTELKHFGLDFDQAAQQKLVDGNPKLILSLLDKLFETDSAPSGKSTRSEGAPNSRLSQHIGEMSSKKGGVSRQSGATGHSSNQKSVKYLGDLKRQSIERSADKRVELIPKLQPRKNATDEEVSTSQTRERKKSGVTKGKLANRASRAKNLISSDDMTKIDNSLPTDDEEFGRHREISPVNISPIRQSKVINTTAKKDRHMISESPPKQRFKQALANSSERQRANGKHQPSSQALHALTRLEQELVDDLSLCKTPFQFVFNSISASFEMAPPQVLSLLADDSKYLY